MPARIPQYYLGGSPGIHYALSLTPLIPAGFLGYLLSLRPADAYLLPLILVFASISVALAMLPRFRQSGDLENISRKLPYIVLRLRTLLTVGEQPIQAFITVARDVRSPLLDVVIRRLALGEPPEEVIEGLRKEVGDKRVLDLLKRILTSLQMGEQAIEYLKGEFEGLIAEKELTLGKALENLSVIMELYMAGGVFAPVVGILMLTSLSILCGGINVTMLIALIVFVIVPLLSAFTAIIAKKFVEGAMI